MFNKSTRSYFFRSLVEDARRKHRVYKWGPHELTWTEARLMFKGATCAAIYRARYSH